MISQVGEIVLAAASEALQARSGLVILLARDGNGFETIASQNTLPEFAGTWMQFLTNPPKSVLDSAIAGESLFAGSKKELVKSFPDLAALPLPEGRSFASTPLMVESRAVGSLVLTFSPERTLGVEDRALLLALARLCAQAIERARLYEAEQEAREAAESAEERTRRLQAITASLSQALTPAEVVAEVVEQCMTAFGAQSSTVARLIDDGRTFQLLRYAGSEEEIGRQWQTWPADMHTPMSEAIRTLSPIFMESKEEILTRFPALQARIVTSLESSVCIPLLFESGAIGAMSIGFAKRRRFSEDDADFLMALGRQCAQALERTRLYEAEKKARAEAEAAQQREAFLAEASAILASSLDYETTLQSVAQLCVPYLGDWCIIDTVEEDGHES